MAHFNLHLQQVFLSEGSTIICSRKTTNNTSFNYYEKARIRRPFNAYGMGSVNEGNTKSKRLKSEDMCRRIVTRRLRWHCDTYVYPISAIPVYLEQNNCRTLRGFQVGPGGGNFPQENDTYVEDEPLPCISAKIDD
jgi:hypothetical protein